MRKKFGNVLNRIKGRFQKNNILTRCFSSIFKFTLATAIFLMLAFSVSAAINTSFGLQGKIMNNTGEIISSGNITFNIGNLLFVNTANGRVRTN